MSGRIDQERNQEREQQRSGSDHEAESDEEVYFGSADEAEGGSVEEVESGNRGNNRREELKSAKQRGRSSQEGREGQDQDMV